MKIKYVGRMFLGVVLLICATGAKAQQDPLYSQYMFNGTMINPAYPTMDESASFTAVMRDQWVGLNGAPKTGSLTFASPIKSSNTSLGGVFSYDKIGNIDQTAIGFNVAQKVNLGEDLFLGLGLRVSESFYKENNTLYVTSDPVFQYNKSYSKTDVGWGLMLYSSRFFVGISSPTYQTKLNKASQLYAIENRPHFYLQSGYLFDISDDVKLKPNIMLNYVSQAPVSIDLNLNVLFSEVLWAGVSWRSAQTMVGILQVQATSNLQIGYAYDYAYAATLSQVQSGSHELMINYRWGSSKQGRIVAPRYF